MRIRIDEKYAEAERAAALDLEGTYDEKVEASDRFFSASQQRKTTLKHDIDRISKEKIYCIKPRIRSREKRRCASKSRPDR